MHFDPRTQRALREVGLDTDDLRRADELVTDAVRADAEDLQAFFRGRDVVYSDMNLAHSTDPVQEHAVDHLDLYTHGADIRGYLRFDTWGVSVEGGRPLDDGTVELSLGASVHDRVRFAGEADAL